MQKGSAPDNWVSPTDVEEEQFRMKKARAIIDLTAGVLRGQPGLTPSDAGRLVRLARRRVLDLFPEGDGTFDMVIIPRYQRILAERGFTLEFDSDAAPCHPTED